MEHVILLHGLGRRSTSLSGLRKGLEKAGFAPEYWPYPSRRRRLDAHIDSFRNWLLGKNFEHPVHFAGHSLGGLIIRGALSKEVPFQLGRIVLIATPNQGAGVVSRFEHSRLPHLIFGEPLQDLSESALQKKGLGIPETDIGVIAGLQRFHPLNPMSYVNNLHYRGMEHDGTVALANTKLRGSTDNISINAHHTFISNHPMTIEQTIYFLKNGKFRR